MLTLAFFQKHVSAKLVATSSMKLNRTIYLETDGTSSNDSHPYGGTAVYSCTDYYPDYPFGCNIEIYDIAIYHSPKVSITQLCRALREVLMQQSPFDIVVGDFNVSWLNESQRVSLYNLFVRDNSYRQLVIHFTTASQ